MGKFLAGLLSLFGFGSAAAQAPSPDPAEATAELRAMVLGLSPADIGLTPENVSGQVWGVVMETGMERGFYTLVVLADGTTSLYFSNGGGIIGAGARQPVREASQAFLATANGFVASCAPAESTSPPGKGSTRFFLLTFDGLRTYTAPEQELGEGRDPLAPLFHAAHGVITQLRLAQQ